MIYMYTTQRSYISFSKVDKDIFLNTESIYEPLQCSIYI